MKIGEFALAGLEQTLNAYVNLDPYARERLAALHGAVIALQLTGLEYTLYLVPTADGRLQAYNRIDGAPDCLLRGSPMDLWRSGSSAAGAKELFAGNVAVNGDTELAHRFGEILGGLDIDWEEQLSRLTGDVVAHQIGRRGRRFTAYLEDSAATAQANIGEYLTEEARLLPTRLEAEHFYTDVDALRDDIERLAARLERLQRSLAKRDKS